MYEAQLIEAGSTGFTTRALLWTFRGFAEPFVQHYL